MTVETPADRDAMLADFGETVSLSAGSPSDITAIVDSGHIETEVGEMTLSDRQMMLTCRTADVAHLIVGTDQITVRGITYTLSDHQPDGTGMSEVMLELP